MDANFQHAETYESLYEEHAGEKWKRATNLAYLLLENYPATDPLSLTFDEVRRRVLASTDDAVRPSLLHLDHLARIQMAWFELRLSSEF